MTKEGCGRPIRPVISSAVEKSNYMARSTERLHLIIAGGLRERTDIRFDFQ